MSTTPTYRAVPVVGNQRSGPSFLRFCNGVIAGVGATSNASLFTSLATLLATLIADVQTFTTALGNAEGGTKCRATVADRNAARLVVERDIGNLRHALQLLGDASPATAAELIIKAGFQVKKRSVHTKPVFAVDHGANSGEAVVAIKSPGDRRTVAFQGSPDGGKSWPAEETGPEITQVFTGLAVGCCGRSGIG